MTLVFLSIRMDMRLFQSRYRSSRGALHGRDDFLRGVVEVVG
jgi:hypothetical protein